MSLPLMAVFDRKYMHTFKAHGSAQSYDNVVNTAENSFTKILPL